MKGRCRMNGWIDGCIFLPSLRRSSLLRIGMIGTDGDLVSSIELGNYVILEADVCSQPYASFLGRAF